MSAKRDKSKAKVSRSVSTSTNAPPPPPWDDSIQYDPANPNAALAQALLNGAWAGEQIFALQRVESDGRHLWVMWRPKAPES
jgi:hypothetical protein